MKSFLRASLALALLPLAVFAQTPAPAAPRKDTITTFRIMPKFGHEEQLRAALTAHAKKWHSGKWAWRVSKVLSGPDGGAYHIVEGPSSWTDLEDRGDLGADHMNDFPASILPHAESISPVSYMTYNEGASTSPAVSFSKKAAITVYQIKPGRFGQLLAQLRQQKAAAEKDGIAMAVWVSYASGAPRVAVVRRFKNGFKDLDDSTSLRRSLESLYGAGAFDRWAEELERNVASSHGEMIEHQPEMSTR